MASAGTPTLQQALSFPFKNTANKQKLCQAIVLTSPGTIANNDQLVYYNGFVREANSHELNFSFPTDEEIGGEEIDDDDRIDSPGIRMAQFFLMILRMMIILRKIPFKKMGKMTNLQKLRNSFSLLRIQTIFLSLVYKSPLPSLRYQKKILS